MTERWCLCAQPPKPTGQGADAAWRMFLSRGLFWRILTICVLWFSSGFSFYGLTLGVNALPFDRYYLTAIIGCVESTSRPWHISAFGFN